MAATKPVVALEPEAVELVDRTMIDLGRSIPIYRPTIDQMLIGEPDSLLIVEFHGHDDATLLAKLADLEALMGDLGHPGVVRALDPAFQADIAAVREAGLNIMMSMKGDGKPVSFIEDCAVDLDDLADYTERLNDVFERHGTKGTWYAHASVGCLHVRPVLNMKDPPTSPPCAPWPRKLSPWCANTKGSHSGEHGDGLVRSEFNEPMFGPRIVRAFEAVKDAFRPDRPAEPEPHRPAAADGRPHAVPLSARLRPVSDFTPKLDWSEHPGPLNGMLGAVEMCNNNGTCRGFDSGVMCPSYRVTRDETHLTRGRANTLRLALTGQLGPDAMASDAMADAMALCVSCKACKRECPTGVDMAKMKIEVTAARAERHGMKWRDRLIAELPRYAPFASRAPGSPICATTPRPCDSLRNACFGLSADRPLPVWSASSLSRSGGREGRTRVAAWRGVPAGGHVQPLLRAGEPARGDQGAGCLSATARVFRTRMAVPCAAAGHGSPPAWSTGRDRKPSGRCGTWRRTCLSSAWSHPA